MQKLSDWSILIFGLSPAAQSKIIYTFFAILFLWVVRKITLKIVFDRTITIDTKYQWRRGANYLVSILGMLLVGRIWFEAFQSLSMFLGLATAGLAVALKEPVANLAAWLFIFFRKPFDIGDRIQIGEKSGDVVDMRIFQFSILEVGNWVDADQSTGRIIHVPNGLVFSQMVANYSKGLKFLWNEIPVLITFESDWKKAKGLLLDIANKSVGHIKKAVEKKLKREPPKYLIRYSILDPAVYTTVRDSGVLLTIRYLCEPHQRRNTEQALWEAILTEFGNNSDIEFAYPTRRLFYQEHEKEIDQDPGEKPLD